MNLPTQTNPVLEGSAAQPAKEARNVEPKRYSWWRRGTAAPGNAKKRQQSPTSPEQAQADIEKKRSSELQNVQATHHMPETAPAIALKEHDPPPPEARVPRRNATSKSDGGSVGSNMKLLSIDDRRGPKQPISPTTAARTSKRAAEDPFGQIPDGAARALKRPEPPSSISHLKNANDHDRIAGASPQGDFKPVHSSQPGVVKLSQPLQPRALDHLDSTLSSARPSDDSQEPEVSKMLLQPETRPITQDQLVNEVKGIYAGLVMVEKKCVEIDQQQSKTTNKLSDEQWQALIALHRTLLYEHHDFFLASQHPSSSAALRRLATKYAMPARMWRHGIHSFLELLRHRLPDSLDHMLAFVYLAYSMMALLMESVPSFVETWIECLGDLARYRMAIEEVDLRDREIWSGCAKVWYEKAADKSPDVGRIQHHLAVLARPNIVQQLFYYSKALVSVVPFPNARESVMLLFNPFLQEGETVSQKYIAVEAAFVTFHGVLFIHGSMKLYWSNVGLFLSGLDAHIGRIGSKFRTQGPEMVSSLCAATYDFGNQDAFLMKTFQKDTEHRMARDAAAKELDTSLTTEDEAVSKLQSLRKYWKSLDGHPVAHIKAEAHTKQELAIDSNIPDTNEASAQAVRVLGQTTRIVAQRIGDKNTVPYMHVHLAFLWSVAQVPDALLYVQGDVPWEAIMIFLNTLGRSGVDEARVTSDEFPQHASGTGRQLPEDFPMRGLIWAQHYFPPGFFQGQVVDEDERTLDLPSHAAPRAERCLWLGVQLASLDRWLAYDRASRKFSVTDYARSLAVSADVQSVDSRSHTLSVHSDRDTLMLDTSP